MTTRLQCPASTLALNSHVVMLVVVVSVSLTVIVLSFHVISRVFCVGACVYIGIYMRDEPNIGSRRSIYTV